MSDAVGDGSLAGGGRDDISEELSRLKESKEIHTGLLRLGLGVEDSRSYWRSADPLLEPSELFLRAIKESWFGDKSPSRVSYLLTHLGRRFKDDLDNLRLWAPQDGQDCAWACHWHLQRTDILYRQFSQNYLGARVYSANPVLEVDSSVKWIEAFAPGRWQKSTLRRLASGLISSLTSAGFSATGGSVRQITLPRLSDDALAYLIYLVKRIDRSGSVLDSPYVHVATLGEDLYRRICHLPGFFCSLANDKARIEFQYASFTDWVRQFSHRQSF